jgi:hypothetical protein
MSKTATVKLKTEGVTQLTKELNSAATAADKLEDSLEGTAKAAKDTGAASDQMSGGLDRMSGGMITMFKGAITGAKTFVMGLRSVKGAMMATGIGALVVIVASLVMYFTKTKKGAELLEIASASLGVIFGIIGDVLSSIGEAMVWAFEKPQEAIASLNGMLEGVWDWFSSIGTYIKESFILNILVLQRSLKKAAIAATEFFGGDASEMREELAEIESAIGSTLIELEKAAAEVTGPLVEMFDAVVGGVTSFVNKVVEGVGATQALTKASIALRQAERELLVTEAKKLAIIAEQEVISKDITKTFAERMAANKLAQETEASLHAQRVANANEALRIHQEQMGLTESLEEDYQKESELMAAAINLNTQSAKLKKKFVVEEAMLKEQMAAEGKAIDDAELLRIATLKAATQSAEQNEIDAVALKYATLNEMARGNEETEKLLKDKHEAELLAITEKYAVKEEVIVVAAEKTKQELRKQTIDAVVAMTNAAFSLFSALDQGREDDDKKTAKARFNRAKAMQIAGAVMSTGSAIIGALSPPPVGLGATPAGVAASITAALTGAASIASIAKTRFDSGGSTSTPPDTSSSANLTTALVPDTFAPSNTSATSVESLTDKPVKAYVVAQDMTSQQAMDANLLHHATL